MHVSTYCLHIFARSGGGEWKTKEIQSCAAHELFWSCADDDREEKEREERLNANYVVFTIPVECVQMLAQKNWKKKRNN